MVWLYWVRIAVSLSRPLIIAVKSSKIDILSAILKRDRVYFWALFDKFRGKNVKSKYIIQKDRVNQFSVEMKRVKKREKKIRTTVWIWRGWLRIKLDCCVIYHELSFVCTVEVERNKWNDKSDMILSIWCLRWQKGLIEAVALSMVELMIYPEMHQSESISWTTEV